MRWMLISTHVANPDNEASIGKIIHIALPPADKAASITESETLPWGDHRESLKIQGARLKIS